MTTGYGISGIGYSPLGNLGLGSTGSYTSYDMYMPSMMGMNYGMGMNGSVFGMGGLYNAYPAYMTQMAQAQQNIESSQLNHAGNMQAQVLTNQVNGYQNSDTAIIQSMLVNSDVQHGITLLHQKINEGDMDGACAEFDKLHSYVLKTYKAEFEKNADKINPHTSATRIIDGLYQQVATTLAKDGRTHDLITDIREKGESYVTNGWNSGFKRGHHKKTADEALNHCFGTEIDNLQSKKTAEAISQGAGRVGSVVTKGAIASAGAVAGTGIVLGLGKALSLGKLPWMKTMSKVWKPAAAIGLGLGMVADILWQCSED